MAERLEVIMGSESVTRQEFFQQLIRAKNKKPSSLEEFLEKDLKHATSTTHQQLKVAVSSISGLLAQDLLTDTPFTPNHKETVIKNDPKSNSGEEDISKKNYDGEDNHLPGDHHASTSSESSSTPHAVSPEDHVVEELESFRQKNGYLGIVILGIRNSDPMNIQRDLAIYFPNDTLLRKV